MLNFEFWINGELSKSTKIWHSKSIFYVKNHPNLFFLLRNINLGDQFLIITFFDNFNLKKIFISRQHTIDENKRQRQVDEAERLERKKEREEKKEAWLKAQENQAQANKQPDANAENGEKSGENEPSEKPAAKPKVDEIPAEVLLTDRQREAIQSQKDKEERDKQRKEDIKRSEAYVKERELRQLVSDCANKFGPTCLGKFLTMPTESDKNFSKWS